jgi:hypothetical protein
MPESGAERVRTSPGNDLCSDHVKAVDLPDPLLGSDRRKVRLAVRKSGL